MNWIYSKNKIIFQKNRIFYLINGLIIIFLLLLPYILFEGKLFLGGDDTRLFYSYPSEYLKNTQFYSWYSLSSVGWYFPNQAFIPFVLIWSFIEEIFRSKIILSYFSFSLSFIFGLIFFQKLIRVLIIDKKISYDFEIILGSLFYILSPIIIQNHFLNPLIPIWLIGLIPAVFYYFVLFLKRGNYIDIFKSIFFVTVFSFGSHNVPWILGFMLPILIALLPACLLFNKAEIYLFIKRFLIFFTFIFFSQFFWLFGFIITFINPSSSSFAGQVVSENFINEFARTVNATSTGNILYPFLNMFHRQISFDFQWNLMNIYLSFYDKTFYLNSIYIFVVFLGLMNFKKYLNTYQRKIYIYFFIAFLFSIFLFTVNIGPLKQVFILLGNIPGFVMFRNAFDKFAMGYVIIYSLFITYSIVVLKNKFKISNNFYLIIITIFAASIFVSALPMKRIVVSPLFSTENIYKNITIPSEYLEFMSLINKNISKSNNILNLPFGITVYSIIKDENTNNVYAGVSPVKIFSGVNDISGTLSFNFGPTGAEVEQAIKDRKYNQLSDILYNHNINYVMITKNVPEKVRKSFLFNEEVVSSQDSELISNITDKKLFTSEKGNYELYNTKKINTKLSSNNIVFKRINSVKYEILMKDLTNRQEIVFNDSFHDGWNLYPTKYSDNFICLRKENLPKMNIVECIDDDRVFDAQDITYIWKNSIFDKSQIDIKGFSNIWEIDPGYILDNFDDSYYSVNDDGSINVRLVLYFKPQVYFYLGIAISAVSLMTLIFLIYKYRK